MAKISRFLSPQKISRNPPLPPTLHNEACTRYMTPIYCTHFSTTFHVFSSLFHQGRFAELHAIMLVVTKFHSTPNHPTFSGPLTIFHVIIRLICPQNTTSSLKQINSGVKTVDRAKIVSENSNVLLLPPLRPSNMLCFNFNVALSTTLI